jgi:hypothetical protein
MSPFLRRHLALIILGALFIFISVLSLLSAGYYGGADNITHYFISRYSFRYPHLFLNAWGRPLYTILSSPFAQGGLQGLKLFNILLGLGSAWFTYRIAKMLEIKPAWLALVLVCFTPLYFVMLPTALTEILFSFVLVLAVYLFIRGSFVAAAITISFIPFARTEGFIMLPLFMLALLYSRQYKAIPFLATGVVVLSLLGCFYYKDLFWVFTQFPYPVTYHHPIYNKTGSLWHFLEIRDYILGLPLELLFLAGIGGMAWDSFSKNQAVRQHVRLIFMLALVPFLVYLAFHAVLFWKAMGGSMGIERVLAAVLPLAALVALRGYQSLEEIVGVNRYVRASFLVIVLTSILITPFRIYVFPFPLSPEEATIKKAVEWFKTSSLQNRLFYYSDNNVPYYMGVDPYQASPALCHLLVTCKSLDTIPAGSVMIWDAHFGANESKIPIDSLLGNSRQQLINYFRPDEPWVTFGGHNYECYITKTLIPGQTADNYAIRDSLQEILDTTGCYQTLLTKTFELAGDAWDQSYLSSEIVHRGKFSFIMDGRTEFSQGVNLPVSGLTREGPTPEILASVYIYLPERAIGIQTRLIISFEHQNQSYSYNAVDINQQNLRLNRWCRVSLTAFLPEFKSPDDVLKVYLWNPGKQKFYMDDLQVRMIAHNHDLSFSK